MKNANKHFHELTDDEYKVILDSDMTLRELAEKYPRPPWCNYPDALAPLGCWSLTSRRIKGEGDCLGCDEYKGCK